MTELPTYLYSEVKKEGGHHADYDAKDGIDWAMFRRMNRPVRDGRTLVNTEGLQDILESKKVPIMPSYDDTQD